MYQWWRLFGDTGARARQACSRSKDTRHQFIITTQCNNLGEKSLGYFLKTTRYQYFFKLELLSKAFTLWWFHLQGVIAMNGSNGGHRKTAITSSFDLCQGGPQQIFTTSGGQEVLMILSVRSAQTGKNCPIA